MSFPSGEWNGGESMTLDEYIKSKENEIAEKNNMKEFAENLVCEVCLYNEQCAGREYTPYCLMGDDYYGT